ncbi:MAG: peptidoglycan-binding domain-containing protein [Eubacteriales bacterium]|nr:peptidoglycan-binding domain-containing protein [Eubacteriales bacterium]
MIKKLLALVMVCIIAFGVSTTKAETLRVGHSGDAVLAMQEALKKLGYSVKTDGKFGDGTLKALLRFQKQNGLTVDGHAGNATMQALFNTVNKKDNNNKKNNTTNTSNLPNPQALTITSVVLPISSLKRNDSGTSVYEMQFALNKLGFFKGDLDSTFGKSTEAALKKFQKKYKLSADGVAGDGTLRLLYEKANISVTGKVLSKAELEKQNQPNNNNKNNPAPKQSTQTTTIPNASNLPNPQALTITSVVLPISSLRRNDSGTSVYEMQFALNKLGFLKGDLDSTFGKSTEAALKKFQKKYKLSADGVAGDGTLRLLYEKANISVTGKVLSKAELEKQSQPNNNNNNNNKNNPAPKQSIQTATIPNASLRNGDDNQYVKEMQIALQTLNYLDGTADGIFGNATEDALKKFQKRYKLSADGVAGKKTLEQLYKKAKIKIEYEAIPQVTPAPQATPAPQEKPNAPQNKPQQNIVYPAPNGNIELLHWFNEVKGSLRTGNTVYMYDPSSKKGYNIRVMSRGRHLDAEPITADDTAIMQSIFGITSWTPRVMYAQLPSGKWTMVATHNVPHDAQTIKNNNFNGHLCVHFLRDMNETQQNDPNYGVQNQNVIRKAWKALTGQEVQ